MSKYKLIKMSLKNFRSFRKLDITFPEQGLVGIRGVSGAGKSTILHGISDALGYCPLDGTKLASWGSEDPRVSELSLKDESGNTLEIIRGSKLSVSVNGQAVKGSASQKEDAIRKQLGADSKLIQALTYRPQRKFGFFLSMPDSKKKEFLSEVLGLDKFEIEATRAAKEAKQKEAELEPLRQTVETLKANVPQEPPPYQKVDISDLERKVQELQVNFDSQKEELVVAELLVVSSKEEIQNKNNQIDSQFDASIKELNRQLKEADAVVVQAEVSPEVGQLQGTLRTIQAEICAQEEQHRRGQKELGAGLVQISGRIMQAEASINQMAQLGKELMQIRQHFALVQKSTCPTCGQNWDKGEGHKAELQAKEADLINRMQEGFQAKKVLPDLQGQKEGLETRLANIQATFISPDLKNQEAALRERISSLQEQSRSELQAKTSAKQHRVLEIRSDLIKAENAKISAKHELQPLSRQHLSAVNSVAGIKTNMEYLLAQKSAAKKSISDLVALDFEYQRRHTTALEGRQRAQRGVEQAQVKLDRAVQEEAALRDFVSLVGREGFLGSVFEEILVEIAAEANARLMSLPNVSYMTIQFDSQREKASGEMKQEIRPVILVNGNSTPLESLSGGQISAVELAVDRGLAEVISRRTCVTPGWLLLDESFDGLDSTVKENALEMLRELAQDNLVLIIDHQTEVKQLFDGFIDVEIDNGVSRVV